MFLLTFYKLCKRRQSSNGVLRPDLKVENAMESLAIFAENLCHSDKLLRHSTLRILCHYELLNCEHASEDQHAEKKMRTEVSQSWFADDRGSNVCTFLLCRCCFH